MDVSRNLWRDGEPDADQGSCLCLFSRKGDERKALIAHILMEQTSVTQKWVVETLQMGSAPYVSRLAKEMGERIADGDRSMRKLKNKITKVLS